MRNKKQRGKKRFDSGRATNELRITVNFFGIIKYMKY